MKSLTSGTLLLLALLLAGPALAGPPLVCHLFDIGGAKSLPWIGHNWNLTGGEPYDTHSLSTDTLSILDGDSTVLVHMETLRRAALYGQKDPIALKQLALRLVTRSETAPTAAVAQFDLGYFAAILNQIHWVNKNASNPAQGLDGYALVRKALQLRDDPQMHFAAALITLDGSPSEHQLHADKAIAGAKADTLLARNLASHFLGPQSETMAAMISRNSAKVARQ